MTELDGFIAGHNAGIDEAYKSQEGMLAEGSSGQQLRFYPFFVQGKKAHIEQIESEQAMLKDRLGKLFDLLSKLRADVKVLDEMKEKKRVAHKKMVEKKMHEEIEEQVQNWRLAQKA